MYCCCYCSREEAKKEGTHDTKFNTFNILVSVYTKLYLIIQCDPVMNLMLHLAIASYWFLATSAVLVSLLDLPLPSAFKSVFLHKSMQLFCHASNLPEHPPAPGMR